jgi:hypothetical protein
VVLASHPPVFPALYIFIDGLPDDHGYQDVFLSGDLSQGRYLGLGEANVPAFGEADLWTLSHAKKLHAHLKSWISLASYKLV